MTVFFLFVVGVMKALSDLSSEGNGGIPREWRKSLTWTKKWETDYMGRPLPNTRPSWMYLWVFTPHSQEKFLYSSTWLVLFTDFWHVVETARFICVIGAVITFSSCGELWVDVLALVAARMIGFTLTYELIKE